MRRIYFITPDIEITRQLVNELFLEKIEDRDIHMLEKRGTPLEDICRNEIGMYDNQLKSRPINSLDTTK